MRAQEKIWKVIRGINGEFTVEDVMVLTEEKYSTVSLYLSMLCGAGYIRKTGTKRIGERGRGQNVYKLIKNTGVKAPVLKMFLYDLNIKAFVGVKNVDGDT